MSDPLSDMSQWRSDRAMTDSRTARKQSHLCKFFQFDLPKKMTGQMRSYDVTEVR